MHWQIGLQFNKAGAEKCKNLFFSSSTVANYIYLIHNTIQGLKKSLALHFHGFWFSYRGWQCHAYSLENGRTRSLCFCS